MNTRREFLFDSYLGLGSLALFDLLGAEASRCCLSRSQPAQSETTASRGQGEELHLPVHGRRREPDGYVRVQARTVEVCRPADAESSAGPRERLRLFRPLQIALFRLIGDSSSTGNRAAGCRSLLPNLATRVDDLAFIHGIKVDNNNHGPAVYHTLTGNQFPGSASIGAWVTYGLGIGESRFAGVYRDGRSAGRDDRRCGRLGQWVSARSVPGHAVSQRRYPDRRSEPTRRKNGSRAAARTRLAEWMNRSI